MATADVNTDGRDYSEDRGLGQAESVTTAVPADGSHAAQHERGVESGNRNVSGAASPAEKKGMVDRAREVLGGVMKGHERKTSGSGVGHTPESTPYGTGVGNEYTDPTAAPAGNTFRQEEKKKTRSGTPGPWPYPTDPRSQVGHTNADGGATLTDEHGNLHPGPQQDSVKKEGFLSKIMDKLHSPRSPKSKQ